MIERWARPCPACGMASPASSNAVYGALGTPGKYFQDFLNGSWLGHPVHPVVTDVVVGGATVAVILDLLRYFLGVTGLEDALTWSIGLVTVAGLVPFHRPDRLQGHRHRRRAQCRRLPRRDQHHRDRPLRRVLLHAPGRRSRRQASGSSWSATWSSRWAPTSAATWSSSTATWSIAAPSRAARRRPTSRPPARRRAAGGDSHEGELRRHDAVLVRRGDVVSALKEACSHAGGPLSEGTLHGDTIVCPWHHSAFSLADGAVRHGPASNRQVAYRARISEGQVEIQGPLA